MYKAGKSLLDGSHIDLDDKKVYNPDHLKFLYRVELYTIVEEDLTIGSAKDPSRN